MDGRTGGLMDDGGSHPFREVVNTFIFRTLFLPFFINGAVNCAATEIDNSPFFSFLSFLRKR